MKNNKEENTKNVNEKFEIEAGEDFTKYGEFVSSYFAWMPLQLQKEKAKKFEKITKKKD